MHTISSLILAQRTADTTAVVVMGLVYVAIIVLMMAGFWKVFVKADQPGWLAIVPIANLYVLCKIAGRPGWWIVLFVIPLINIFAVAAVSFDIAKSFGKGLGFGIGLWLLSPIFYPILGFGRAEYQGPTAR